MGDFTSSTTTTMRPSILHAVDEAVVLEVPVVPVVLADLEVPVVPVDHQRDSADLMDPDPEDSDHLPRTSNEAEAAIKIHETVPVWIAQDEAEVRADLIKADLAKDKPTMALPSAVEEAVEAVAEVVVEAAIRQLRHHSHSRTKRTPDH